jgi:hypothetical protein
MQEMSTGVEKRPTVEEERIIEDDQKINVS